MRTQREEKLLSQLQKQLELLKKSSLLLNTSWKKCAMIGVKEDYTLEEYEEFDALTSRFARTSDILTQKILGIIDALELEEKGTFLDKVNRAEQRGIISSAQTLKEIRELRNEIAHEYVADDLNELYADVLRLSSSLLEIVNSVENYSQRFLREYK